KSKIGRGLVFDRKHRPHKYVPNFSSYIGAYFRTTIRLKSKIFDAFCQLGDGGSITANIDGHVPSESLGQYRSGYNAEFKTLALNQTRVDKLAVCPRFYRYAYGQHLVSIFHLIISSFKAKSIIE